jgi:hypothetical protein
VKRIILIAAGCGLTWTCAAVGIYLHHSVFGADVSSTEVASPPVASRGTAPAPDARTIPASAETIAEAPEKPPREVVLSCRGPRFRAIRRAVEKYCRAPADDEDRSFLCPRVTNQLKSCRSTPRFSLLHARECHGSPTLCHDFRATLPSEDEIIPFITLDRPAGRWKVVQLEYDDLERP